MDTTARQASAQGAPVIQESYPMGRMTVSCGLYRERGDVKGDRMYTLRMEHEGHGCELLSLTMEEGKRILDLLVSSQVSPVHAGDVLEDMLILELRGRFVEI